MARPLRIAYPGACYHVTNRGDNRRRIFSNDGDWRLFFTILVENVRRFGILIRAYAVMPNHFHLYLQTPEPCISQFMHLFEASLARALNKRHEESLTRPKRAAAEVHGGCLSCPPTAKDVGLSGRCEVPTVAGSRLVSV